MKKSVWDIMPIIIAFVLVVSIFSVLISIIQQRPQPAASIPIEPISNKDTNIEDNENPPDIDIQPYYTELPKPPKDDDYFLFRQTLEGYGDIHISKLHHTSIGTFAIVEVDTKFGDISVEQKSIAICKISKVGIIEKIFILPSYQTLTFIDSQINTNGLSIMCYNQQNTLLFTIDYDLDILETLSLPLVEKGRLFSSTDNSIILTECSHNTIYKYHNSELATAFLPNGKIVEIFDFCSYIVIIVNQKNSCCIIKLSPLLKKLQETYIDSTTIKAIAPLNADNQQYFIIAEELKGIITLHKYNSQFNKTNTSSELGAIDEIHLIPHDEKITAIFSGSTKGIYSFDSQLTCTLLNVAILQNIETVFDFNIINNKYYLLCTIDQKLVLITCSFDSINYTQFIIDNLPTSKALFVKNSNSTVCIYYQNIDQLGNNYVEIACCSIM